MSNYAKQLNTTSQTQAIFGRESEMVQNNAGGVVFQTSEMAYLDRFLILGSEQNSYYASAQKLTRDSAKNILGLIAKDPIAVVDRIVEISDAGRAPKNDPAIFALALVDIYSDVNGRTAAYNALPKVCRIGTHLFQFVETLNELGKWNALAKRGVSNWYNNKAVDNLAFGLVKYQQRNGWSHRDVLRLTHVKPVDQAHSSLYRWVVTKELQEDLPLIIHAFTDLHSNPELELAVGYIKEFGLTHEMLPTQFLKDQKVWEALLPKLGYTALIRNLGRMGAIGMLGDLSEGAKNVIAKINDTEALRKSRVHPINILAALKTYSQGHGDKGSLTWPVNRRIVDALNDAFYAAFKNVEPTGKNFLLGVDCSGSMFGANVIGLNNITAAEAAGVMALAIAKVESNYWIGGFNTRMGELRINPNMTLDTAMEVIRRFSWGGTDCALPMLHAIQHRMDVDAFVTITDNETWAGRIQPIEALRQYRKASNKPNACNIVVGTSTTKFTIADPKDPRTLDIVGFDSAAPQIITDFAAGRI